MQHSRLTRAVRNALLAGATAGALGLTACGGGGSSSGGGDGDGTLNLGITDAPVDDAKRVIVSFDGVTLKPADGDRIEITFDQPKTINLLELQGDSSGKLLDGETVPAGRYDWIELDADADDDNLERGSTATTPDDSFIEFASSGKHELVLPTQMRNDTGKGPGLRLVSSFNVPENGSADFTIDFDLRKSVFDPKSPKVGYLLRPALRLVDNATVGHITAEVTGVQNCSTVKGPAIYVFNKGEKPNDVNTKDDKDVDPVTTAQLTQETGTNAYTGKAGFLEAGDYQVAFTCQAGNDVNDADNNIGLEGTKPVTVEDGKTAKYRYNK